MRYFDKLAAAGCFPFYVLNNGDFLCAAENKDKEIEYQEKILKVRLQALGIPTEDLELKLRGKKV